jgi:hypothetical protein
MIVHIIETKTGKIAAAIPIELAEQRYAPAGQRQSRIPFTWATHTIS